VGQVVVHTVWLSLGRGDWNVCLRGVIQQVITALETFEKFWHSPWGDYLDLGVDGKKRQLETDLVVALALLSPIRKGWFKKKKDQKCPN
jgi:hypothetical protein